jgi:hypothetical protein
MPSLLGWAKCFIECSRQKRHATTMQYWHGCNGMVGTVPAPEFVQAERSRPRVSCDLRVNLIWKNVPRTKMVVSPSHHVPIEGDANVAKYMCRVLCPALYSADVVEATEIDHLLDLADSIVGASSRNQKPALKQANQKLGKVRAWHYLFFFLCCPFFVV